MLLSGALIMSWHSTVHYRQLWGARFWDECHPSGYWSYYVGACNDINNPCDCDVLFPASK